MSTESLADFILARIAEDVTAEVHDLGICSWANDTAAGIPCDCGIPARVLASHSAKRRIIALHFRTSYLPGDDPDDGCIVCGGWPCDTLRLLALPYADHPDYRQEWRA